VLTPLDNPPRLSEQRVLVSFFELFQPGLRYLREEKDRQKILVAKPSHGGAAPLGIDLDAARPRSLSPEADATVGDRAAVSGRRSREGLAFKRLRRRRRLGERDRSSRQSRRDH